MSYYMLYRSGASPSNIRVGLIQLQSKLHLAEGPVCMMAEQIESLKVRVRLRNKCRAHCQGQVVVIMEDTWEPPPPPPHPHRPSSLHTHINTEVRNQGELWKLEITHFSRTAQPPRNAKPETDSEGQKFSFTSLSRISLCISLLLHPVLYLNCKNMWMSKIVQAFLL